MELTIIEFILVLAAHAIVGIYSAPLKYSKKKIFVLWGTWAVIQSALLCYSEFVLADMSLQFFFGFFMPFIGQYILFFVTTKGRCTQRMFIMLTYSIFFCISMALFTMVKGTVGDLHPVVATLIQTILLGTIVSYFLYYVCPLCRAAAKNVTTGWVLLIYVNVFFVIMVIFSSVFPIRLTSFGDPAAITFIFLSVCILAVYPVIFSSINSMAEVATKREVERQNKILLAQLEKENMQLAADSRARHDRRHHNLVMLEFANNNDIESIREYLRNLVESENEAFGDIRYCENKTVNTILTVYERRARENGISVKISVNASRELDILPQDLVIVIANIFENAIHAAAKLKGTNKYIDISIKESAQRLVIKVENACQCKVVFDESLYGVGIRSVIATTNKYEGMYDFSAENGIFSAKISLNLK